MNKTMTSESRNKKLFYTTFSSILLQIITIISGFILPKLYLTFWGSELNGLVTSITQFLSLISFLDLGVGQVVQSNLYKPLAERDYNKTSEVLTSGKRFFRTLAHIFLLYVFCVALFYPLLTHSIYEYFYVFSLVLILAIDSFSQYYFGVNYQMLLNSDQRGYIHNYIKIVTILINILACVLLLNMGFSLHFVKLITAFIHLLRPLLMYLYIKKNYPLISFNVTLSMEPIKQKWNGFAQHLASVVQGNTDIVVLTLFSTLTNVSIYSVYNLVVSGIKQLLISSTAGVQAVLGELWAKQSIEELESFFYKTEWLIHTITVIIFGCTALLILPFVQVYTNSITDAEYLLPSFAYFFTFSHALHCIRLPYNSMVLAGGHFKQTQNCYLFAALINIVVSIILVRPYGLVGISIGTLIAMLYQIMWLVNYLHNNFFNYKMHYIIKQTCIDLIIVIISIGVTHFFVLSDATYFGWIVLAIKTGLTWLFVSIIINLLFYKQYIHSILEPLLDKVRYHHLQKRGL